MSHAANEAVTVLLAAMADQDLDLQRSLIQEHGTPDGLFWRLFLTRAAGRPAHQNAFAMIMGLHTHAELKNRLPIIPKMASVRLLEMTVPPQDTWRLLHQEERNIALDLAAHIPRDALRDQWSQFLVNYDRGSLAYWQDCLSSGSENPNNNSAAIGKLPDIQESLAFSIDDSPVILKMMTKHLAKLDFECRSFEDPVEALNALKTIRPSIIFTDLNMPQMSGLELAAAVRSVYNSDELPIVLVSAPDEDVPQNLPGIDIMMPKPFNRNLIQEILTSQLVRSLT